MSSDHQTRRLIDEIALAFETQWSLTHSGQWLVDYYARYPCDELLAYLVAADSELVHSHGAERSSAYYVSLFPDKQAVIEAALAVSVENTTLVHDSQADLAGQFFVSLPCNFGKYRILRCIGRGGMAAVFEAEAESQKVAIKLPYPQHQGTSKFGERFQKEIRLLSNLRHPNIVPILESGRIDDLSYYTMPLIDGEGLNEKCTLHRFAALSTLQSARYMLHATQALASSHAQGVLHRDIKPSNILVDSRDHVWVVDFGLATFADSNHSLTRDGQLLGTPTWMPPEQACGDYGRVDERSDVYALGATLYSLLTGRAPFTGATTGELLLNIQRRELIPPRHLYRHIPGPLQNIVLKCMEKEPGRRYSTAAELAIDLKAFLEGQPVIARPPSWPVRSFRWCRLYPRWAMGMLAMLCILAVLAVSTIIFRHIANLQNQIAHRAQQQRDAAVRSEELQKQLRSEAEAAQLNAMDAAGYAQAQQMRSAFATFDAQLRAGNLDYAGELNLFPTRASLDTEWYTRHQNRRPTEVRAFCTGDWGHYDVAMDRERKLLATAGREGDVAIWDMQSEQLVKYCRQAERDPDKGFAWIRWRYHAGRTEGFTPTVPPEFASSVAWTGQGNLLVAGLNGELVEHTLGTEPPRTIYRSPRPLYFVRTDAEGQQFFVADEMGNCSLLDSHGSVLAETALEMQPNWAGFASSHDAWIVAGDQGQLVYVDRSLRELGRLSIGSKIHQVQVDALDTHSVLITSDGQPPRVYRVALGEAKVTFDLHREFVRPGDAQEYCQALIDRRSGHLVAMDERGGLAVWDLEHDRPSCFGPLLATKDIRHPYPDELKAFDTLERRSRYFLLPGEAGALTIDCMGTVREYDCTQLTPPPTWNRLSTNVGPGARLAADQCLPGAVWTLDKVGYLRYVDVMQDRVLAQIRQAHTGGYTDIQTLTNGEVLTAGNDVAVRIWRFHAGAIQQTRELVHRLPLVSVAVHEGQGLAACGDIEGSIHLFDLASGVLRQSFRVSSPVANDRPVHTGRLAFSQSGKYLVGFSRWQDFECIDLEQMKLTSASKINLSGDGGVDVIFGASPGIEHRFLVSSQGTEGNEIEQHKLTLNPVVLSASDSRTAVDFAIADDGKRIVSLCSNGELVFYSPEHFVSLATVKTPASDASALAITPGDSSMVVATADGDLYAWIVEPLMLKSHKIQLLECRVQPIEGAESLVHARNSSLEGLKSTPDRLGHMTTLFVAGGLTAKSQLNRLYMLRKEGQRWITTPLRFEGDEAGPCEHASLYMTPKQELLALIRQGQISIGDYDGRLLLARETEGVWKTEVLEPEGNSGFSPFPIFAQDDSLKRVLHLDYHFQRLFAHHRSADNSSWQRTTIRGCLGGGTAGVRDAVGATHIITRPLRGWDAGPPNTYMRISATDEIHFEEAQGNLPFINKRGQLFSYHTRNGQIWLKRAQVGWDLVGAFPVGSALPAPPTLDNDDQLWWAACLGRKLMLVRCDVSALAVDQELDWQVYFGQLEHSFSKSTECVCNMHHSGVLEVLIFQSGQTTLGMVEVAIHPRSAASMSASPSAANRVPTNSAAPPN